MKMCYICNKAEVRVNGYYCMPCKVKKNKESIDRNKNNCKCGAMKRKQSITCRKCIPSPPVIEKKSRFDSCSCGAKKNIASVQCMSCYRISVAPTDVRGPMPKNGEVAIYLLRKNDRVFYVGSTYRPKRRIKDHRQVYGEDVVMLIIKIVSEKNRWREEILATLVYEEFFPEGIVSVNPGNTRRKDKG